MAILKVARLGHPVLREKAKPIPSPEIGSPRIQQLIDDMFETMAEYGGTTAYSKKEAANHFKEAAQATTKPFIYLSAGVSNAEFTETLRLVSETGVKFNGVLCGRATWKDGIAVYAKQGADAFRKWLETEGVKNINAVNEALKGATSWHETYGVHDAVAAR
jgi:tagatose 1,6-diphosphate aldolase